MSASNSATLTGMRAESQLLESIGISLKQGIYHTPSTTINYVSGGTGSPALLLHGASIGWGQWYPNLAALAKQRYLWVPDLPGSGRSQAINFRSFDPEKQLVEPIEQFITDNIHEPFDIIGHSIGGWLALRLALRGRVPLNKLVLSSSLGFSRRLPLQQQLLNSHAITRLLVATAMKPSQKNMERFIKSVLNQPSAPSIEFMKYFHANITANPEKHPFFFINGLIKNFQLRPEFMLLNSIREIKNPTLLIPGRHDPLVPLAAIEKAATQIPNASLIIFEKSGHVPSIEEITRFNQVATEFLV